MADDADDLRPPLRIDPEAGGYYPLDKLMRAGRRGRDAAVQRVHDTAGRMPPQAPDAETSVLGAMMLEADAIPKVIEILPEEVFYSAAHQQIYAAVRGLFERGEPVDLVTLTHELRSRGHLESAGGAFYLTELTTRVASAANVEYHARIVAQKGLLRKLIETATLLVGKAYDPASDAFELLDEAERDIFQLSDGQMRRAALSMKDVIKKTLERLDSIHGNEGGITGVPSGLTRLDALTGGWQKSDLIIVAARPSMGKTAFSLAIARNAALHPQAPAGVAYFSLEMSADQLAQRLLTSEARVDAQAARTGRMNDQEWASIARAAGRLSAAPIYIDDTPGLSILELRAKCRRLKAEHNIGLIIVDYLQLMHGSTGGKNANREQEIAQISRSLKALAKELDVPVIALSQLSRAVETRGGDKRPQLSDLRESGSIEQDADLVAFLYRAEKYGITVDDRGNSTLGVAEVILGKQRNGPLGNVEVAFVNQYARFDNLSTSYYDDGGGGGYDAGGYDEGGGYGYPPPGGGGDGFGAPGGGPPALPPGGGAHPGLPSGPDAF